jgi:hypothetical protein
MAFVVWHVQDPEGKPIGGAVVSGKSTTMGDWSSVTNACGDCKTTLGAATYDMTFEAYGFVTRLYPATIGDSGEIITGLERGAVDPFKPAPRFWAANMCGIRIPGLPPVPGGAADPSLLLSWFYDRYDTGWRAAIRGQWQVKDYTHVLLSWPDSHGQGATPESFLATCKELIDDGFYPCVMLSSKDFDSTYDTPTLVDNLTPVINTLVGTVPMFCIGWELSIWRTPTQVQDMINALSPLCMAQAGTLVYVHFQEGYPSFQQPGGVVADFWNPNVGKLTGLLYQKRIAQTDAEFLDSINDCLERFAGGWGMVAGFDFVALELTAMTQFNGSCSEAEGNRVGRLAINAPAVNGTKVSGSGNGH